MVMIIGARTSREVSNRFAVDDGYEIGRLLIFLDHLLDCWGYEHNYLCHLGQLIQRNIFTSIWTIDIKEAIHVSALYYG
jgi:hypothetical protein